MLKEFLNALIVMTIFLACSAVMVLVVILCIQSKWWAIPIGIILIALLIAIENHRY
jgi:1,4-dihydroxy-2-naphthoate octaprenyltransferase